MIDIILPNFTPENYLRKTSRHSATTKSETISPLQYWRGGCFSPASIQRLQSIPGLVELDRQIGPIHLMKVSQPLTWFLEGERQAEGEPQPS
jgi:hypothetical protein